MQLVQAEDCLRDAKSKLGSLLYEDNSVPAHNSSSKGHINKALAKEKTKPVSSDNAASNSQPSSRPVDMRPKESSKDRENPCNQNNTSANLSSHLRPGGFRPVSNVYERIKQLRLLLGVTLVQRTLKRKLCMTGQLLKKVLQGGQKESLVCMIFTVLSLLIIAYFI